MIEAQVDAALDRILERRLRETRLAMFWGRVLRWAVYLAVALVVLCAWWAIDWLFSSGSDPL